MLKRKVIINFMLSCLILTGCNTKNKDGLQEPVSKEVFAMDTYMKVTAYGTNAQTAVNEAVEEIRRLDSLLSTENEASEVFSLNQNGGGKVSNDTRYLLERSLELWNDTQGKFDITVYPVMRGWGFTNKNFTVLNTDTLGQLLTLVDASAINLEATTVTFKKEGLKIDLGGIAKGYASAKVIDIFKKHNVTKGIVSLGGNVQVLGRKNNNDLWQVAIQNPDSDDYLGVLQAEDCAVITSGGYERYFEQDGVIYHHIIDPTTGYPANSGLKSVTIVSEDGTLADGLSTSLFIMGKDKAIDYWQKHSNQFDTILVDNDGIVYVTEGIAGDFTTKHKIEIIEKIKDRK